MADSDVSPIVAKLVERINLVPDVGLVSPFDIYSASDLAPLIVSEIAGVPTLRAWWVTGPVMSGRPLSQDPTQWVERRWVYQIHGVVGVVETGSHIATLRELALAVTDAIDTSRDFDNLASRVEPCNWIVGPENRTLITSIGVAYVQIQKPIVTVSRP